MEMIKKIIEKYNLSNFECENGIIFKVDNKPYQVVRVSKCYLIGCLRSYKTIKSFNINEFESILKDLIIK